MTHTINYTITFPRTNHSPVTIDQSTALSTHLTLQNSPILFGCRTGICGTCLVSATGKMAPPNEEEQEVLEMLAPTCSTARLACQIKPHGDLAITPLKE
ncbi:MAG: 2Fe-2S iron-sulfur cluster-binding protein [Cyanobacteria bacterium J06621_3]